MKVLSYNCRGLGADAKKAELRDLIKSEQCDVVFVQETKLSGLKENEAASLGGNKDWKGVFKGSEGRSGGLLIAWNSKAFIMRSSWDATGVLIVNGIWIDKNEEVCLVNVYGPCIDKEKLILWDLLESIYLRKLCLLRGRFQRN